MRLGTYLFCVATCLLLAWAFATPPKSIDPAPVGFSWELLDTEPTPKWFKIKWKDGRILHIDTEAVTCLSYYPEKDWGMPNPFIELTLTNKTHRIDLPDPETARELVDAMFIEKQ